MREPRKMERDLHRGYKILTHDLRPPVRGGQPLFTGSLPVTLGPVEVDTGPEE